MSWYRKHGRPYRSDFDQERMQEAEAEKESVPKEHVPKREIVKPKLIVKIEVPDYARQLKEGDALVAPYKTTFGPLVMMRPPAPLFK